MAGEMVMFVKIYGAVTVTCEIPLTLPFEAVIVVVPAALAVKVTDEPVVELRVPTVLLVVDQVTCTTLPFWSVALNT